MSVKITLSNENVQSATGVTTSSTSSVVDVRKGSGYSVMCQVTEEVATLAGTVAIQMSLDNSVFVTVDSAAIAGTGNHAFNVSAHKYPYMRVVVTVSTGTAGIETQVNVVGG